MYLIDYKTGITDTADTLDEAKEAADKVAAYTQRDIVIYYNDREVVRRQWWDTCDGVDEYDDPITFGSSGFYSDWTDDYEGCDHNGNRKAKEVDDIVAREIKAYKAFMYNPENSHNCTECPANEDGMYDGLPCGQQNCWVDCHCNH